MSVEDELRGLSPQALETMSDGISREMQRLSFDPALHELRETEDWVHATWKAMSIMSRAVEREIGRRAGEDPTRH